MKSIKVASLITVIIIGSVFTSICADISARKEEQKKLLSIIQTSINLHEKVVACKRLAVIGDEESIPVLSKLLEDEQMHHIVRFALEPNPSPEVDKVFRSSLDKLQGKLLIGVINSIGVRRDPDAVPKLIKLLNSKDVDIAAAAGAALGCIGTTDSAKALMKAIPSAPPQLKIDLASSAIVCGERLYLTGKNPEAVKLFDFVIKSDLPRHLKMAATRGTILARGDKGLPILLDQLRSNDDGMFAVGLRVAREYPSPKATIALINLYNKMPSKDVNRLSTFLEAIGDRNDPAVIPLCVKILNESTSSILQLSAIKVVGKINDDTAISSLLKVAAKSDGDVATAAYNCLITLGGKNVDSKIIDIINSSEPEVKTVAIKVAGERNIQSSIPALVNATKSESKVVRLAAISSLGAIGSTSDLRNMTAVLLNAKDKEELDVAEEAINSICGKITNKEQASAILIENYPKAGVEVKCSLLRLLAQTPSEKALDVIRNEIKNSDSQISKSAARSLCQWQGVNGLEDILKLASESDDPTIKVLALRGLVRIVDQNEIEPARKSEYLRKAMTLATKDDERKLILAAAGNCASTDALKMTAECIEKPELKGEAAAALISIGKKLASSHPQEVKSAINKLLESKVDQLTEKKAQEILNTIK